VKGRQRGLGGIDWLSSESERGSALPTPEEVLGVDSFSSWIGTSGGSTFGGGEPPAVAGPNNRVIDRSYDSADEGLDPLLIDSVVGGSVLDDRLMRESLLSQSVLGAPRSLNARNQPGTLNPNLRPSGREQLSPANPTRASSLGSIKDPLADLYEMPGLAGSDPSALFEDSTRLEVNPIRPNVRSEESPDVFRSGNSRGRTATAGIPDLQEGFYLQGRNQALGRSSLSPSIMPERKFNDSRERRIDFRSFPERRF